MHLPCPVDRHVARIVLVRPQARLKPEQPAEQRQNILKRSMALLSGLFPALLDKEPRWFERRHPFLQEPPETFARRIESLTVVEPADDGQQLIQREIHDAPGEPVSRVGRL